MLFVSSYWMCESIPILITSYFERYHFVNHHYCGITVEEMVPNFIKIRPMLKKTKPAPPVESGHGKRVEVFKIVF